MDGMKRRDALRWMLIVAPAAVHAASTAGAAKSISVRGILTKSPDGKPALMTTDGKLIYLHGDPDTMGVLNDARLANMDFEALGHYTSEGHFEIDPIHERAMFVHKDGKRLMVTYWCNVCYIRTYTPGPCWCCQKYTDLDLRESVDE